jgi:GTP-binding protein
VFRDECSIVVQAGRGGDGCASFRREKFVPRGGPDGGDGGDGGDVTLLATARVNSLLAIGRSPCHRAEDGRPGSSKNCAGARGADLELEVPVGTQVFDARRGNLLKDLARDGERLLVARGGRGGRGNAAFASAVRQAPRRAEGGTRGEERELRLELKLFAEVGLVGLPNAGKSTLLAVLSRATPKIADYPFTTLAPEVGIVELGEQESLVFADLPGLIQGAAAGAGLGHRFLRHVERCRALLHLVDVSGDATAAPLEALRTVEDELARYSTELAARPRLIVATKVEDGAAEARAADLERAVGGRVWRISAVRRSGLKELLEAARGIVRRG